MISPKRILGPRAVKVSLQCQVIVAIEALRDKALLRRVQQPSIWIDISRDIRNRRTTALAAPLYVHGDSADKPHQRDTVCPSELNRAFLKSWVFRLIVTSDSGIVTTQSGIVTSDSDDRDHPGVAGWSTTQYGLYFEPIFRSPTR